jgi:hypothetical protein
MEQLPAEVIHQAAIVPGDVREPEMADYVHWTVVIVVLDEITIVDDYGLQVIAEFK